jgi:hypothetical protein
MTNTILTQARLKELLHYDPTTGVFTWLVRTSNRVNVGDVAGYQRQDGYIRIRVDWELHLAHRLAFLYMTGEFPPDGVDHMNGIPPDNKWLNLRHATQVQNAQNQRQSARNKTGFTGVSWDKKYAKFRADIKLNGKQFFLGYHDTVEAAYGARCKAKRELHTFNPIQREAQI